MGRIGKEVALRALAFGMDPIGFDVYWDADFATSHNVRRADKMEDVFGEADVMTLHLPLTDDTQGLIRAETIALMKPGAIVITRRGAGWWWRRTWPRRARPGRWAVTGRTC